MESEVNLDNRVLFIDDDVNLLAGVSRSLRNDFSIMTCPNPLRALEVIEKEGPFSIIVSDLAMPQLDGIQLLTRARSCNKDSVRILLTGNGDMNAAIKAINEGNIFHFLLKPCSVDDLKQVLQAGLSQYRLVVAEKVLLEQTLHGAVRVLVDILSLVNPVAFGRSARVRHYVTQLAERLIDKDRWKVEMAGMLSQIGCVSVPPELLEKVYAGAPVAEAEEQIMRDHPLLGRDLIAQIPRLEEVAQIIEHQKHYYDGSGWPENGKKGEEIPVGAQILSAVLDYEQLESQGYSRDKVLKSLQQRRGKYSPKVLESLANVAQIEREELLKSVKVEQLQKGMLLEQDVKSKNGMLIATRGLEINEAMIRRLNNYNKGIGVVEPFVVRVLTVKS